MKLFNLMRRKVIFKIVALTLLSGMLLASPAFAGLSRVGPQDQMNGFPEWYSDQNDLFLAPCLDPVYCLLNSSERTGNLPHPGLPVSFPGNFPAEFSYWSAEARISFPSFPSFAPPGGTGEAILRMSVIGGFTRGAVSDNEQKTWSQITISITGLRPGHLYKIIHPFGAISERAGRDGSIFYPFPFGSDPSAPPLSGSITAFLEWDVSQSVPDPLTGSPRFMPPAGFVGDPEIPHQVTGGPWTLLGIGGRPIRNRFYIGDISNIVGLPVEELETDLFKIEGKRFTGAIVSDIQLRRGTYARPLLGLPEAQVFIEGDMAASDLIISSRKGESSPLIAPMILKPALESGLFQAKLDLSENLLGALMPTFTAVDPVAKTVGFGVLVDEVVITEASYDKTTSRLTVKAASKDEVGKPPLVVLELPPPSNTLDATGALSLLMPNPPEHITVQSAVGGMATALVRLTGPSSTHFAPPIPAPVADAGLPSAAPFRAEVQLSATASSGIIESYSWIATNLDADGRTVPLNDASTASPTFSVPFTINPPLPLTFELAVSGPGGQSMAQVTITPTAPPPPPPPPPPVGFVGIDRAQAKLQKGEWKIDGHMDPVLPGRGVNLVVFDPNNPGQSQQIATALPVDDLGIFQLNDKGILLTIPQANLHVKAISFLGIESAPFLVQAQ